MEEDKQTYLDQAVDWMITLQEHSDDQALRSQFEEWLETSDKHQEAWQEISSTKSLMSSLLETEADELKRLKEDELSVRSLNKSQQVGRVTVGALRPASGGFRFAVLSSVFCLLLCLLYFSPLLMLYLKSDYMTGVGDVRVISMVDGSKIHLDSQSAIQVDFEENSRTVHILKGRAFFDVSRDENRPFKVKSNRAEVTVLGTQFEVDTTEQKGAVSVVEGAVSVQLKDVEKRQKLSLTKLMKGDRYSFIDKEKRAENTPEKFASWRKGKLIVDGWYAKDVIDELGRYYNGSVFFNGKLASLNKLSGVYDLNSPKDAIKLVAATEGLKVKEITPWILVVSQK